FGGSDADVGTGIAVDASGNMFVTGQFVGTADFAPGVSIASVASAGGADGFLVKLNNLGNYAWSKTIGGAGGDRAAGVAGDSSGKAYVTGAFSGAVNFGTGASPYNISSAGTTGTALGAPDGFVAKYQPQAGALSWAASMGGTGADEGTGIALDPSASPVGVVV